MVQKLRGTKNTQGWEIGAKDNILTVQDKEISHISNKTNRSLEMTPRQRKVQSLWLKGYNLCMKKRMEK